MKGYYKNWYQHYLEIEAEKEQELKKGYYSNLTPKTPKAPEKPIKLNKNHPPEEKAETPQPQPLQPVAKKKRKFRFLGMLLPISTLAGFVFLWYQMDIGPTRQWVNEALVFSGLREVEPAVDVLSYHRALLDQHEDFIDKLHLYVEGSEALVFEELTQAYNELRLGHRHVVEITDREDETIRLWSLKVFGVHQLMNELQADVDITETYPQFLNEQLEIRELIREELALE